AHPGPVSREQLLALFWPDLDRPAAQQTLRTTLHGLRQALGGALSADDGALSLAPEVAVDSRAFEASLATPHGPTPHGPTPQASVPAADLITALDLYQGDFLEGFSLPDSAAFEDWAAAERERLRRLDVRGLARLARDYEAQRNYT